ncbi:hypothetical protein [Megamonas hypermegale]|uniref:hypothetical protein n=1 Tax=Megamonas hypermegale TaxID=158847 RepID=UPI00320B4B90
MIHDEKGMLGISGLIILCVLSMLIFYLHDLYRQEEMTTAVLQKSTAARNLTVSEASKLIALYEQNETLWLNDSNAAEDKYELADGIMVDMRQEKTNQFSNAVINAYLVHYQGDMYILIVESTIEDITNQVCIYLTRKDDEIIVERWER